jgi:LmbE family N-acetylglucosaminyl deacetylase/glycosyltransferase involved in cell wall biosynthesis
LRKTIGVAIICKNEEVMIERCLASVAGADQIVVCDTGSADNTVEILRRHPEVELHLDVIWNDDFAYCQNECLKKMRTDFVLSIDSDEYLNCPWSEVQRAVDLATTDMIRVLMIADGGHRLQFGFGRLFRNSPDIYWVQPIHKHLNLPGEGEEVGNVSIVFGHSPAHNLDPNRTLRILERVVSTDPAPGRNLYYLGREYWYKQRYAEACATLGRYVNECHNWDAERAESFLVMSMAYSRQGLDNDARDAVLQAINLNSNFKEAIDWMANISKPHNALQWRRMARTANNKDVMWDRVPAEPVHDVIFLAPHNDDESLFGAYTLMRHKPLVIVITDGWIQFDRGDYSCSPEQRKKETIAAMNLIGCPVVFLGIPDNELTDKNLRERLKAFNPETIYIPAKQGGNHQHDLVNEVAIELFGRNRCEQYSTYSKTQLYIPEGYEIKPTQVEIELKNKMLECYQSQLNLPSTRPHFEAVIGRSEWLL